MASQSRRVPAATTVTLNSGQTIKQQLSSRALQPQTIPRITAADVQDPERLARAISDTNAALAQTQQAARTNPIFGAGGIHLRNLPVTSGVAKLLFHNLGRPFVGYIVTRVQGANPIDVRETTLPTGVQNTQALNLVPSASGTIDVWVF
jgi:hypothetical protein